MSMFGDLGLRGLLDFSQGDEKETPLLFKPYKKQMEWGLWAFSFKEQKTKLLMGARGYGKTETVMLYAFIEELKKDPHITALLITRREDRYIELIETLGVYLDSQGFKGMFKQKSIRLTANRGDKNPTLKGLTVGSKSFKGNHVDFVIMDDPLDPTDEWSPALQRRVNKVYSEVKNIARSGVIVIGQPVTEGDLYDLLRPKVDLKEAWYGEIKELDKPIDSFRREGMNEREIQKNYFGILIPPDERPFAKYIHEEKGAIFGSFEFMNASMYIDPSFKGKDYTAVSIGCFINNFAAVVGFVFKKSWIKCEEDIINLIETYNVTRAFYEDNGTGDAFYVYFRDKYDIAIKNSRLSLLLFT